MKEAVLKHLDCGSGTLLEQSVTSHAEGKGCLRASVHTAVGLLWTIVKAAHAHKDANVLLQCQGSLKEQLVT